MSVEKDLDKLRFDGEAATPRTAATVLCAREGGPTGFEILMIRRPAASKFAGGQYVFPGGKVDATDAAPVAAGVTAAALPRELPEPLAPLAGEERWAVYRAAAREIYEEVGVLLAEPTGAGSAAGRPADALAPGKELMGREAFYRALAAAGLRLRLDRLHYWTNWITPRAVPIRFDTHFFVALVDPDDPLERHPEEVEEAVWLPVPEVLDRFAKGAMELMFPTYKSLEQIAGLAGVEELVEFVAAFPKLRVEPEMVRDEAGGVEVKLPDGWPVVPGA